MNTTATAPLIPLIDPVEEAQRNFGAVTHLTAVTVPRRRRRRGLAGRLALDRPALLRQEHAELVAVIALNLDQAIAGLASASALRFELLT